MATTTTLNLSVTLPEGFTLGFLATLAADPRVQELVVLPND